MEDSYTITQASTDQHILDILALQRKNVKQVLTTGDIEVEGFVTCEHDFALLKKMNQPDGHIIALSDEIVVGYCLVMSPLWRDEVEVIRSMFDTIEKSSWNGQAILPEDYVVMGQVCIDKSFRRRGVFRAMYQHYKETLSGKFQYCITEVATSNHRSLNAHAAIGFENLLSYIAPDQKSWELIIWDWNKSF